MILISNKISMFDDVLLLLLFCCFVILLNVLSWQTTKQPDNKTTKQQNYFSLLIIYFSPEASQSASFGWKPIPSTARVTRDEVSGLLKEIEVMLSGRQYPIDVLARLWLARHVQRQSRIKPMRRICSFTDFFCVVGFICACRALGLPRIISCGRHPAPYRRKCNP